MSRPPVTERLTRRFLAIMLAAAIGLGGACGGEPTSPPPPPGPPPPPPPPPGVISIAPSVGSVVIQQGAQASITVLVVRAGNFTGAVAVAVEGLPAGVTAAQSNISTTGANTTTTITFTVSTSAVPGRTDLVLRATGNGVADAAVLFSLQVIAPPTPTYVLGVTGSPLTLAQGANGQVIITIDRSGGFAGNVALAVQGAPVGLTTSFNPAATTGGSSTLTIFASAGLAPGTYPLTVIGAAAGLDDRMALVQVTVTAVSGTGAVTFDFSQCGSPYAIWAAYQDGAGPWTRVTGVGGRFQFTVNAPTARFAWVVQQMGSSSTIVNVQHMTRAEMSATPIVFCPPGGFGQKFINGAVVGLASNQSALVTMGGGLIATPTAAFPTFVLGLVPDGDRDLVAYRWANAPTAADRIIIRRDLNVPNGGSVANLDFAAAEAQNVATATLTINGLLPGEAQQETMSLLSRVSCDPAVLYLASLVTTPRTIFGVPASLFRPTDFHNLRIDAAAANVSRFAEETFGPLANRTVTMPGRLDNAAVAILAGTYKRLEATYTLPVDYNVETRLSYITLSGIPRSVQLVATPAWVASTSARLTMPDFTGVTGWSDVWAPATAVATRWTITASGRDGPGSRCRVGARTVGAAVQGTN